MPSGALGVIVGISRVAIPGANTNIRFPVSESANKLLEFRAVLDRTNSLDLALAVCEDEVLKLSSDTLGCFVPG